MRQLVIFLVLLPATGLLSAASAAEELLRRGELLAEEDFSRGLDAWAPEGDVDARVENGRLRFEALERTDVKKGNIWWKRRFSGPVLIEYDYQSATEHGLSMFWFNAHGRGGADLLATRRSGVYDEYVKGDMNGYHVSYHRFGSGVSNLRKSYGFHMLSSQPEPIPAEDLDRHRIQVYAADGHIRISVDGELVHEVRDTGENCIEGEAWHHEYPCDGTGDIWRGGYIGIRHTQRQAAFYDNFKVYRLVRP